MILKQVSMNILQQNRNQGKTKEDLESQSTEADAFVELHRKDLLGEAVATVEKAIDRGLEHHTIAGNVASGTFTADKMFKFTSAVIKVMRGYQLTQNLKPMEKLGAQIGQVRRLLRVDRVLMLLKEFAAFSKKKNSHLSEKLLILFKIMILMEDVTDLTAFLIQLKVIKGDHILAGLKKKVAHFYFFECVGWLIYYTREYYRAKTEEDRFKNKMAMMKYVLDGLCAHNELNGKLFHLQPRVTSVLSLLSGSLNLFLVWK